MTITYQYFENNSYVLSVPKGIVSLQDVLDYAAQLQNDQNIVRPFMEIVDFQQVESFDFGYFESEALLSRFRKLKESKGYKGACLVVEDDKTKSMSNMLRVVGEDVGLTIKTFSSVEQARQYIKILNA